MNTYNVKLFVRYSKGQHEIIDLSGLTCIPTDKDLIYFKNKDGQFFHSRIESVLYEFDENNNFKYILITVWVHV